MTSIKKKTTINPKNEFMQLAIREAFRGMNKGEGGPFGAIIVHKNQIIARTHNKVIGTNDPTAHAEILAIRKASQTLGRFDLSDCEIYATSQPCPMCMAAIYWAKMRRLFYGCTKEDAAKIHFDDRYLYQVFRGTAKKSRLKAIQLDRNSCLTLFRAWTAKKDKIPY